MRYDPALDGLRAISVAAVVILHAYKSLMPGGWAGVEVFFVLSGFLITNILLSEIASDGRIGLGRFYMRRFFRLGPALIALLAFCLLVAPFQGRPMNWGEWAAAATYTMNWYRALALGSDDLLGHTWSLAVEEQFYLLWPLFLVVVPGRFRLPATLFLIMLAMGWRAYLAAIGADPYRANGFDAHCDTLLIGSAMALVWGPRTPEVPSWLGCGAAAGLVAVLFTMPEGHTMMVIGISLVATASCVLLLAARQAGALRNILVAAPLVYTGRISYGLYLWHYPIVVLAIRHLPPAMMWISIVISYGVAWVSYLVIEKPALALRDYLEPAPSALPADGPIVPDIRH